MTDEQTKRLIAAAPELLIALRTIATNSSSVQMDPQWAVQIARNAVADLPFPVHRWLAQATRRNVDGKQDYLWTQRHADGMAVRYDNEEAAYSAAARACADPAHGLYSPRATLV